MTAAVKTSGKDAAALALHRFGFGAAGDQIAAIAGDPRGALLADLDRPNAGVPTVDLPSSGQAARAVFDFRAEEQAKQKLALRAVKESEANGMSQNGASAMTDAGNTAAVPKPPNQPPPLPQQILFNEAKARFDAAASANIGLVERLVWFWSNHFCVSADKIPAMAGAYEREAIRPHVLGRFADLLIAAESHPAMLFYLDNVESMGADSVGGINRDKGLNENLARETLELHTLGVRSGYSQEDVTSFAKVLTGWTWFPPAELERGGEFVFSRRIHEPGDQTVLGKVYPDTGVEQGRAVLADLAHHPATAQHIAQKLARHFVADEPPPSLVTKLANTFTASDGNLKQVAKTLVTSDEAWMPQRQKLKSPAEWVMGVLRLTGTEAAVPVPRIMNVQAVLGQPLWRPPAPNGYADIEAAWIDGVGRRLDIANELAGRVGTADPLALLDSGLGPLASADTRGTIARAESRRQAVALLVMAPEYLRR
ncbi:MAG TPA: DUF1800 family protein [Xanthobacteraceae bacterium]|nr:DUF1800 family protein [Xanthobacteraceae bacterium]